MRLFLSSRIILISLKGSPQRLHEVDWLSPFCRSRTGAQQSESLWLAGSSLDRDQACDWLGLALIISCSKNSGLLSPGALHAVTHMPGGCVSASLDLFCVILALPGPQVPLGPQWCLASATHGSAILAHQSLLGCYEQIAERKQLQGRSLAQCRGVGSPGEDGVSAAV